MDLKDLLTIIEINNQLDKSCKEFYEASIKIVTDKRDETEQLYYIKGESYLNIFDCIAISIERCNLPEQVIKAHFSDMLVNTVQSFLNMGKPFDDMLKSRPCLLNLYGIWFKEIIEKNNIDNKDDN